MKKAFIVLGILCVTSGVAFARDRVVMGTGSGMTRPSAIDSAYRDAAQQCGSGETTGEFHVVSADGNDNQGWDANVALHCVSEPR
jgi:hypothetical protein